MIYNFPFLVQPKISFEPLKTTALTSYIRSGKTYRSVQMALSVRDHSDYKIPLYITEGSRNNLSDVVEKAKSFGVDEDDIIFLNKDQNIYLFTSQLLGAMPEKKFFYVFNANHHHYKRVIDPVSKIKDDIQRQVLCIEDEFHRGFDATRILYSDQLQQILRSHRVCVSATAERFMHKYEQLNMIKVDPSFYTFPTDVRLEDVSFTDEYNLRNRANIQPWIPTLHNRIQTKSKDLCLINGVFQTSQHQQIVNQLTTAFYDAPDYCVYLAHGGKNMLIVPGQAIHEVKLQDAQSVIDHLHNELGYKYIHVVSHKQGELGQTIADRKGNLTLGYQITGTSVNPSIEQEVYKGYKMEYHSLAQWNRNGGYNIPPNSQTWAVPKKQFDDWKTKSINLYDQIKRCILLGETEYVREKPLTLKQVHPEGANVTPIPSEEVKTTIRRVTRWEPYPNPELVVDLPKQQIVELYDLPSSGVHDYRKYSLKKLTCKYNQHGQIQILPKGIRYIDQCQNKWFGPIQYHNPNGEITYKNVNLTHELVSVIIK
jgi:hypothetical protein